MAHIITQEKYKKILESVENSKNYLGVIGSAIVPLEIIAKTKPENILLFDINTEQIELFNIYKDKIINSNNNHEFIQKISGIKSDEIEKLKENYEKQLFIETKNDFRNYWSSLNLEERFEGEEGSLNHRLYKNAEDNLNIVYFSQGNSFFNNEERFKDLKDSLKNSNISTVIANITSNQFPEIVNKYFKKGLFSNKNIDLVSLSNIIPGEEDEAMMYLDENSFNKVKENLGLINKTNNCKVIYGLNPVYSKLDELLEQKYENL